MTSLGNVLIFNSDISLLPLFFVNLFQDKSTPLIPRQRGRPAHISLRGLEGWILPRWRGQGVDYAFVIC